MNNIFRFIKLSIYSRLNSLLTWTSKKSILIISPNKIDWIGINMTSIIRGLTKSLIHVSTYSPTYNFETIVNCESIYKDINIDEAISYSLCVELEIMPWQFDAKNRRHVESRSTWRGIAKSIADEILAKVSHKKPALIVYLQGYILETNISLQIAKQFKIKTLAIELTFNSDKLIAEDKTGIAVNYTSAKSYYHKYSELVTEKEINDWFENNWNQIQKVKHTDHVSNNKEAPLTNYLLYLGQVFTDSSSLFGLNSSFIDQTHIIKFLMEYCTVTGKALIIKLHPKEKDGYDPVNIKPLNKLTHRKLTEIISLSNLNHLIKIDSDNQYNTNDLIKNCEGIITINSQAGLEATVEDKPVILCGNAFYDNLGFTKSVSNFSELESALKTFQCDTNEISTTAKKFIYIYFNYFCVNKNSLLKKIKSLI